MRVVCCFCICATRLAILKYTQAANRSDIVSVTAKTLWLCLITHADGSRVSIALIRICDSVCLSVCLSVRTTKPKRLKLKSQNLAGIVHHDTSPNNEY